MSQCRVAIHVCTETAHVCTQASHPCAAAYQWRTENAAANLLTPKTNSRATARLRRDISRLDEDMPRVDGSMPRLHGDIPRLRPLMRTVRGDKSGVNEA
jgi:hypothetical protein